MKYIAVALCLFLVAACDNANRHTSTNVDDIKTAQYMVKNIRVEAANSQIAVHPQFNLVKTLTIQKFEELAARMPQMGKPVDVTFSLDKFSFYIDTAQALLLPGGDRYYLEGYVTVTDSTSGSEIEKIRTVGFGGGRGGLIGLAADASYTHEEKIESAISSLVQHSSTYIYPELYEKHVNSANPRHNKRR